MMYIIMCIGSIIIGIVTAVSGYVIFDIRKFNLDAFILNMTLSTIWHIIVFIFYKIRGN